MRGGAWARAIPGMLIALLLIQPYGSAAEAAAKSKSRVTVATGKHVDEKQPTSVQIVSFPETEWNAVKIVRGGMTAKDTIAAVPPVEKPAAAEIVTFGDPTSRPVRVLRGDGEHPLAPAPPPRATGMSTELVAFADPHFRPVTVLRGSVAQPPPAIGLFGPARGPDLDRVAFAVEGAESSHGTDPQMWQPNPNGPQGPMQVSAAAAADLGGGNRFDLAENRMLGRGYLALMYQRYGNWPDAIAAYNWGPGNMDAWIGSGRWRSSFPLEVERYQGRVLRDAGLDRTPAALLYGAMRGFAD